MTQVSVVPCASYDPALCRQALLSALEPIDGLGFVKEGMTVGIKANLVSFMKPDSAATTHPVLLAELTKLLTERGAKVIVGDSPGGLYTAAYVKNVYRATGMYEVEAAGAELNYDFEQATAHYPEAAIAKSFQYTAWLDHCDAIIDFCKIKTHGMMAMSAAAKNMFGVIPGTLKPEYHYKYPNAADFARMIIDLDEYFKPVLSIADGVVGMEGNGPTMGKPRPIGVVMASGSPHMLDLACAKLIGLERKDVPTLEAAYERGLIPGTCEELSISGSLEDFVLKDFDNVGQKNDILFWHGGGLFEGVLGKVLQACLRSRPKVAAGECVGCAKCAEICPAKAIEMKEKLPRIQKSKCIQCFCCQEFCPKGAMKVARPFIAKMLNK